VTSPDIGPPIAVALVVSRLRVAFLGREHRVGTPRADQRNHLQALLHGKKRAFYYACNRFHQRGPEACSNHVDTPLDRLNDSVIAAIAEDVLDADAIEAAVPESGGPAGPRCAEAEAERLRGELATVNAEIGRLTNAIASGVDPVVMSDGIRARQARRTELEAALATAEHLAGTLDLKQIRAKVRARIADWQKGLRGHVAQGRQVLRKFMDGPIDVEPLPDGSGVRVRGQAALGRILAGVVDVPMFDDSPSIRRDSRKRLRSMFQGVKRGVQCIWRPQRGRYPLPWPARRSWRRRTIAGNSML